MRGIGTLLSWVLFYAVMAFLLAHFLAQERGRLYLPAPAQTLAPTLEEKDLGLEAQQNPPELPAHMPCHYGKSIYNQDCAGAPQERRKITPLKIAPPETN
ncbi:hypothetical protein LBMAG20_09840 [Methylocystaceae bacterium]|nr:hypothetical protein LBMAG20_09840 [Methylocystaceae bacterium]